MKSQKNSDSTPAINHRSADNPTAADTGFREMSSLANDFIGHFRNLNIHDAQTVEPAFLSPICAVGDFLNISGPSGCGKSSIAQDILLGAAHPQRLGKALGGLLQFTNEPYGEIKCAVLDSETSSTRWASKLAMKIENESLDPTNLKSIRYSSTTGFGLTGAQSRKENSIALAEALGEDFRKLVIIDTQAMAWGPSNINDPDWVFEGLLPFREKCQEYGICVISLTHTRRKSNNQSAPVGPLGTSFQENAADAQIMVTGLRPAEGKGVKFELMKARRAHWIPRGSTVNLQFTDEYGYKPNRYDKRIWAHTRNGCQATVGDQPQSTILQVEQLVKAAHPEAIAVKDIATSIGHSTRSIRKYIAELHKLGTVKSVGSGPATKWVWVPCQ